MFEKPVRVRSYTLYARSVSFRRYVLCVGHDLKRLLSFAYTRTSTTTTAVVVVDSLPLQVFWAIE